MVLGRDGSKGGEAGPTVMATDLLCTTVFGIYAFSATPQSP